MTNLGAHITGHPRHDYDIFAAENPRLVVSVDDGGVLEETKRLSGGHAVTVFRDTTVYPEAPPDINSKNPDVTWAQFASYWYNDHGNANNGGLKKKWLQNPADFYTPTNEQGGNDPEAYRNLIAYERELMKLANADGLKVCVLNLAGGSPGDFTLWQEEIAPFIVEAWRLGNIYGRHVYGDHNLVDAGGHVLSGQPSRPIEEIAWLNSQGYHGGLAITECGLDDGKNFAGIERFTMQMTAYEKELRPYADIIGIAMWNLGPWQGDSSSWQDAIPTLVKYMNENETDPWAPGEVEPPPPPDETDKQRRWRLTIEEQEAHGLQLSDTAIQKAIRADGFQMVTKEMYVEGEPPMAGAEDWAKRIRSRRVYQWVGGRVEWFVDPGSVDPPPPVGDVDLLPYMAGVLEGNGPLYELQASWGPQERAQTQWHGGRWLTTKGNEQKANWEERWADDEWIYFGTDTSESEIRYYTQRTGLVYGAVWCQRRMTVGQYTYREPTVTHYSKLDCQPVNSGTSPSYLHFISGPKSYTFERSGIVLDDVVEMGWSFAPDGLSFVERYLFAVGYGLVGWFSQDGRYSWISEIHEPGQRPDNKPLVIPCLDTG